MESEIALTLIEEVDQLPPDTLSDAYEHAGEWLTDCQSQALLLRFKAAGKRLAVELRSEPKPEDSIDLLFNRGCRLPDEVLKFERTLISTALAKSGGRITHAATLLGIGRQRLAYIIDTRHRAILHERTPVRRRAKKTQ